jgi:hypothetical protein
MHRIGVVVPDLILSRCLAVIYHRPLMANCGRSMVFCCRVRCRPRQSPSFFAGFSKTFLSLPHVWNRKAYGNGSNGNGSKISRRAHSKSTEPTIRPRYGDGSSGNRLRAGLGFSDSSGDSQLARTVRIRRGGSGGGQTWRGPTARSLGIWCSILLSYGVARGGGLAWHRAEIHLPRTVFRAVHRPADLVTAGSFPPLGETARAVGHGPDHGVTVNNFHMPPMKCVGTLQRTM